MQITRHWRMNALRYRLEGIKREDGSVSLQDKRQTNDDAAKRVEVKAEQHETVQEHKLAS